MIAVSRDVTGKMQTGAPFKMLLSDSKNACGVSSVETNQAPGEYSVFGYLPITCVTAVLFMFELCNRDTCRIFMVRVVATLGPVFY